MLKIIQKLKAAFMLRKKLENLQREQDLRRRDEMELFKLKLEDIPPGLQRIENQLKEIIQLLEAIEDKIK